MRKWLAPAAWLLSTALLLGACTDSTGPEGTIEIVNSTPDPIPIVYVRPCGSVADVPNSVADRPIAPGESRILTVKPACYAVMVETRLLRGEWLDQQVVDGGRIVLTFGYPPG